MQHATGHLPSELYDAGVARNSCASIPSRVSSVASIASIGALAVAVVAAAGAAHRAAADVVDGATFNDPLSDDAADPGNRAAIQNHIIDLINGTPSGATIRISTFIFASGAYRDALLAAHTRGVNVQLLVDESLTHDTSGTTFFSLANGLGRDTTKPSFAVLCPAGRGCIGSGIDHDKFFLFSTTGGHAKVVVQTSANTVGALKSNDEALLKIWNHDDIFEDFQSNFQTLAAQSYQTVQAGTCK